MQQYRVDYAEHTDRRSDTKGDGSNDRQSKTGLAPELSKRIAKIAKQLLNAHSRLKCNNLFFNHRRIAETNQSVPASFSRWHSSSDIVSSAHLYVRVQLINDLPLILGAESKRSDPTKQ
jgi:hypothetical protein